MPSAADKLAELEARRRGAQPRRDVLLCTGGKCADPAVSAAAWTQLTTRISSFRLDVHCARVGCQGVCAIGPVLIVQPDNVRYGYAEGSRLRRIIDEHLRDGAPVRELLID